MEHKKRVLSLFSGCGGMDLGFEGNFTVHKDCINLNMHPSWIDSFLDNNLINLKETGFQTVFANDIKRGAKLAWDKFFSTRNPNTEFHSDSIVDLVKKYRQGQFQFPKNIDVLTGGFPCQDFSLAGKRNGFNSHKNHNNEAQIKEIGEVSIETRGMLYYWMREVIDIVKPKVFIAENVKGLLTLGDAKKIIQQDFSSIAGGGYHVVDAKLLNARHYGVPQNRERVFFIGFLKEALKKDSVNYIQSSEKDLSPFPKPTHKETYSDINLPLNVTLGKVLEDLNEPENEKLDLSQKKYSKAKWMGKHCQGQTEVKLDSVAPTIRSEHHGNIEFRRLNIENGGKNKTEINKGLQQRRLTIRECARIQTFPDNYEFVFNSPNGNLSASEAYKLIGNAVPPLLAYNIAQNLNSIWDQIFITEIEKNDYIQKQKSPRRKLCIAS